MKKMTPDKKIDLLIEELKLTNQTIEQFLKSQFNILNITLVLIGAYTAFTISSGDADVKDLIKYLPFFILGIVILIGYHFQRTMALQGYKKYLEAKINSIADENLIFYAHMGLNKLLWSNLFSIYNLVLYPSTYLISCVLALKFCSKVEGWESIAYLIAGLLYVAAFIPVFSETKNIEKLSHFINKKDPTLQNKNEIDKIIDLFNNSSYKKKNQDWITKNPKKVNKIDYFNKT